MKTPTVWKITCMEEEYPGLWRLWFKNQCVTDGHSPHMKWKMTGKTRKKDGWIVTKNALTEIQLNDLIVVALPGRRIGRIGKVIEKKVGDDEWDPLFPGMSGDKGTGWGKGFMGRRISVHWELNDVPYSPDTVIQLHAEIRMRWRGTMHRINKPSIGLLRKAIADKANWVEMVGRFGYEWALSDYIANYPHRLKDGLEPYPNQKEIREKVFDDDSRADVLLLDGNSKPVIVECKQNSPIVEDVQQLRRYIGKLKKETHQQASGILVHGGARTVDEKVWHAAEKSPRVELEIFQYKVDVDFAPSYRAT